MKDWLFNLNERYDMKAVFFAKLTRLLHAICVILISSFIFEAMAEEPKIKPEGTNVIVYENAQFLGDANVLKVGAHSLKDLGVAWNDKISSIYVPAGYVVYLFEHDNFQGRYIVAGRQGRSGTGYQATLADLSKPIYKEYWTGGAIDPRNDQWNDRISSLIIYASEAAVPQIKLLLTLRAEEAIAKCSYPGGANCVEVLSGTGNGFSELNLRPYPLYQPPKHPTDIPLDKPVPLEKTLYWDGTPGVIDMVANGFVMEVPDITLFGKRQSSANGQSPITGKLFLSAETGRMLEPRRTMFNDNLHAIQLCSGCRITIYQNINYDGRSISFTGPGYVKLEDQKFWVLANRSDWKDRMSSFKVTFPPPPKAK
jgi:hypothetical protein